MSPQLTDADIARHDASAGKVLTDADIAARDRNPQGYLSQVGTGLWNTVKGLYQVGTELSSVGADPLNAVEHLKNLKRMVVDPQVDQAIKAADEWKKGNHSEAVGHALAAVLPGVGPAAANIGEKLGNLDYTGAAADATVLGATIAAPKVAGAVADVAPRIAAGARVVGAGIKAAAPEVATGTAVAGAGELVGHVVPGAEWATRLAGGQLMRSGVAKGLKAAREAMRPREAPAAAAEAAAPSAAPTPAINVNPPLQLPPGPIITPAPADTSYVRSVPAEYPPTFTLTPSEQALADHILQNVEPPQPAPPPPPPPPAEPPASPGSLNPPAAAKPTSAEIAAQPEASMRAETLTDYVTRKKIPAAMVENFSAPHWEMIARDAGVQPPNPQQITEILDNLAQRDAAKNITATTAPNSPAEAAAEFQQNRALRNPGEEPPAAAAPEPAPPPPPETPPAGAAAPKHAIDVAGRGDLPDTKWMTEDGLREYAADNQMTEDAARTALAESGHKILGRAKLNRAIHALGGELGLDHDTIRDTAAMTYGVKSLTQLTQDQMLQMYEHLAEQQSASQPLVGKSARGAVPPPDALAEKLKVLAGKPDAARFIEELKAQATAAPETPPDAAPPAAAAQTLRDLMQPAVSGEIAFRSSRNPGAGLALNDQGILYTSPDEAYTKTWGEHTQKLRIIPQRTLDLTKFAHDATVSADAMRAFLESNGIKVSDALASRLSNVEEFGGEPLQYFGQIGKPLVQAIKKAGFDSARINEYVEGGGNAQSTLLFNIKSAQLADSVR